MKKLVLLLFLSFGLTSFSVADYLDDWPDDPLCAWMENPSTPSYISDEVKKKRSNLSWWYCNLSTRS